MPGLLQRSAGLRDGVQDTREREGEGKGGRQRERERVREKARIPRPVYIYGGREVA